MENVDDLEIIAAAKAYWILRGVIVTLNNCVDNKDIETLDFIASEVRTILETVSKRSG